MPKIVFMPPHDELCTWLAHRFADTVPEFEVATLQSIGDAAK